MPYRHPNAGVHWQQIRIVTPEDMDRATEQRIRAIDDPDYRSGSPGTRGPGGMPWEKWDAMPEDERKTSMRANSIALAREQALYVKGRMKRAARKEAEKIVPDVEAEIAKPQAVLSREDRIRAADETYAGRLNGNRQPFRRVLSRHAGFDITADERNRLCRVRPE